MKSILIASTYLSKPIFMKNLNNYFKIYQSSYSPDKVLINQCHVLVIRTQTPINKVFLQNKPHLELIISATSGKEHIDRVACKEQGVAVIFCSESSVDTVAEYNLLLMLQLSWKLDEARKHLTKKLWKNQLNLRHSLSGKTLGIIGLGRIGSALAIKAKQAFDMKILFYDPSIGLSDLKERPYIKSEKLKDLLNQSDIISLQLPLNEKTKNFFKDTHFSAMKKDSIFINTARGGLVCQKALLKAIKQKVITGFALDVFSSESKEGGCDITHLQSDTVILTPHIATHTKSTSDNLSIEAVNSILDFYCLKKPVNDTAL